MRPIRATSEVSPDRVLYHSAFGFARIASIADGHAVLEWSRDGENLPEKVSIANLQRVYAICEEGGFFDKAVRDRETLQEDIHFDPVGALHMLLSDLRTPQRKSDIQDWFVGRLMTEQAFQHWWESIVPVIPEDPRFEVDDGTYVARDSDETDILARLRDPKLAPSKRLDIALSNREDLEEDVFVEAVITAWRTGTTQVRDLALASLRDVSPDDVINGLLSPGPESIEAVVHAVRRAGWKTEDVSAETHAFLVRRLAEATLQGGSLDSEGRLAAALTRWGSPGIQETLVRLAKGPDGQQLVRSTFAALPPRRSEKLALDLLELAVRTKADPAATHWLTAEILESSQTGPEALASELEGKRDLLVTWLRDGYDPFFGDEWVEDDEDYGTAELEVDWLNQPVSLVDAALSSGSNTLSLALGMVSALAEAQAAGIPVNPCSDSLVVHPDGSVEFVTQGDPDKSPRLPGEAPSLKADLYALSTLLVESITGRPWPRALPVDRALPYLRHVAQALPPSTLGPLDAAMSTRPEDRPKDAAAWKLMWDAAVAAEETRAFSGFDADVRLDVGYDSHIGKVKLLLSQTNQDCVFVAHRDGIQLLIVCDGISTATAGSGDVASSITSHVIAGLWEQALPRLQEGGTEEAHEFIERALRMANQAVCEAALRFAGGRLDGRIPMGTTALVAVVRGNRVSVAWQGDSRAYLHGPYGTALITADMNQAGDRFAAWVSGQAQQWDPNGYALVGYVGHFDEFQRPEPLQPRHITFTLLPGERLLMCTDGITDYIADNHPDITRVLAGALAEPDLDDASRRLTWLANKGGGGDNATVVVASLTEDP